MGILNIRKAKRGGSKAIVALAGPSGSGKTVTALKIARGMVDKPEEIGFLDTENKRGSLYADLLDGPFLIGDLIPVAEIDGGELVYNPLDQDAYYEKDNSYKVKDINDNESV